jgi:hypothetical protein
LLEAGAALFERFYADPERRARAENLVKRGWSRLPLQARIELVTGLAEAALRRGDRAGTLRLTDDALVLLEGAAWKPEDRIALGAPLIVLRHSGGDALRAEAEAGNLLAYYNESRDRIVNMDRADALRAVAEAFAGIGDSAGALGAYRRAAEEGMENPNARPRADDLVATCLAMAASGVEPDARLAERLRGIRAALRDPW